MKKKLVIFQILSSVTILVALILGIYSFAVAHCDTLDGPVIQDARKALDTKDVTPVLKWVSDKDEKVIRNSFTRALSARGKKSADTEENHFFATLIKIHRAGEGASFTGLKPAGQIEPSIIEADKALASGSSDALVKMITDDVAAGIRTRHAHVVETYKHKDESVEKGREFVKAYVDYTHYVERIHLNATGKGVHDEHSGGIKHSAAGRGLTVEQKNGR